MKYRTVCEDNQAEESVAKCLTKGQQNSAGRF